MIYLDNSSTSLIKPDVVAKTLYEAVASRKFSNPSRGFYDEAINSSQAVYDVRETIADFFGIEDPLNIAFTANITTSLNLVLSSLFKKGDHLITSLTEHNSVLRPLYQLEDRGVELSFIDIDDNFNLKLEELDKYLRENTKAIVITAESNVSGAITDLDYLYDFAIDHDLLLIIDGAQAAGTVKIKFNERKYPRIIFCITGHKALFGPSGTGAIIDLSGEKFKNVFTGGSGVNSFDRYNPVDMPDVFEYGTINFHSIIALGAGVKFIDEVGIDKVSAKIHCLRKKLFCDIKDIPGIKLYSNEKDTSIVSFNYKDYASSEISEKLYKMSKIASRGGIHCAPLFHERVGTKNQGIVRLSLSYFNNEDEIDKTIETIDIRTIEELDIEVLKIKSTDDKGEDLKEEMTNKEIYQEMRDGKFFKTSQITYYEYLQKFEDLASKGISFICITLSSGMSGTFQNACMAKREIEEKYPVKIEVIDSLAASVGFGQITYFAGLAAKNGASFEEVVSLVKFLVKNTKHIFTVFDLKYLYEGGRVSRTKARISSVLNIFPILEVDEEGKIYVSEIVRGKNKSYRRMVEIISENSTADGRDRVFPVYADDKEILNPLISKLEKENYNKFLSLEIGQTIAAHVGPDICGLGYLAENIPEEFKKYLD